ncbi:Alpha/Beta hydrolase protein [Mycena rebaudengoi]|nr:Alpha/Beta hydrolase protein [Mycena rebaudengoi]
MDASSYKDIITSRGIKYHYFFSPAAPGKPTLVFLHGFPANAQSWRHQVVFFVAQGYGVIAPDLLGYGGTDKPTDIAAYAKSLMAADIISIMDEELNGYVDEKVYAVGHDWGSGLASGLATFYPSRFAGFAFLSVGYIVPNPEYDIELFYAGFRELAGHECFGYWRFFAEDGADKVIEEHIDAFINIVYPADPKTWITDLAPIGKLKERLLNDKVPLPASSLTPDEVARERSSLLEGGLAAPLCWYKQDTTNAVAADNKLVPKENYIIKQPVFFGGGHEDYVCVPKAMLFTMKDVCPNLTVREYQTGHWIQLSAPDQLNKDLLEWVQGCK